MFRFRFFFFLCFKACSVVRFNSFVSTLVCSCCFWVRVWVYMNTHAFYTCMLRAAYAGPMYAYAYSSPETLICIFLLLFLYFIYNICLYFVLILCFWVSISLFMFTYPSHVRLGFSFQLNLWYAMSMHSHVHPLMYRCCDAVR